MSTKSDGTPRWLIGSVVLAILAIGAICIFLVWRMFWVTSVDNHEMAFCWNRLTGKIEIIQQNGWVVRAPIVNSVHTIDLRPYQIQIVADIQKNASGSSRNSGNNVGARILNAKLVRFNPSGLKTFIEWHGRDAGDNLSQMLEILKAYAFSKDEGRECPFLTVISDITPKQNATTPLQPLNPATR